MITIATATAALSPPLNLRHATELRDRGYTVIPDAGISADLVKDARFAVASEFSRLLDNLEELGIDPVESSYAFKELDKRHANRWSVRPTQAESAWTRLVDSAVAAASPVVPPIRPTCGIFSLELSLIHISEPTRLLSMWYGGVCV